MTKTITAPPARSADPRPDRRTLLQLSALGLGALGAASGLATGARPGRAATAHEPLSVPEAWAKLAASKRIDIGVFIYPDMDQIDFTGPFEVLVRLPGAHIHVVGLHAGPIRDYNGLILTPQMTLAEMPEMDLLVVPGGPGEEAQIGNAALLTVLRRHAAAGKPLYSVCTGALLLGAAGLLKGRKATTHWAALEALPYFGAQAMTERVVVDGNIVSAAGVTAGIDGALMVAAMLRGVAAAQAIQLGIQYQPEPAFHAGSPETAPPEVLAAIEDRLRPLRDARIETARAIGRQLGIPAPAEKG
jgi:cyclohexyl-isocyanide hydratase